MKCPHCDKPIDPAIMLGSKGGKAGTGKSKVRGDSDYYRKIRAGKKPK